MALLREIKRRAGAIAPQAIAACIMLYFGYHAVQGDRGLLAWARLTKELESAQATEARLGAERQHLESRVHLLQPSSLDPDLLEEQARLLLNYTGPNEVVIMLPHRDAPEARPVKVD